MSDDFQQRGGSPWGTPPGGEGNGSGRGPTPPDVDKIIREIQEKIKKPLAEEILFGKLSKAGGIAYVELKNGEISIEFKENSKQKEKIRN